MLIKMISTKQKHKRRYNCNKSKLRKNIERERERERKREAKKINWFDDCIMDVVHPCYV